MLTELERQVLRYLKDRGEVGAEELENALSLPKSTLMSVLESLKSKGYLELEERIDKVYELTEEGRRRIEEGLPEDRLVNWLAGRPRTIAEVKAFMREDFEIALGWARRKRLVEVKDGLIVPKVDRANSEEAVALHSLPGKLAQEIASVLKLRNLVKEKEIRSLRVRGLKFEEDEKSVTFLTTELLVGGKWRDVKFRPYNVEAMPPPFYIGKKHFFVQFLEHIRDVLVSMGFTEVKSDYVELEFFNFDLLFQPQDHPAREIHDSLALPGVGKVSDAKLLERVKEMHERNWKYRWSEEVTSRIMLRSQATATTARTLASRPTPPVRTFTVGKVFRYDTIDATHLPEFFQLDGLIVEEGYNFRRLLGTLSEIFRRIGIERVRFKPAYFPFTEPSVEAYGFMEGLGWVEVCGAGLLRDEIMLAAGVQGVAGAWGIGLDRLAMMFSGVKDIRELYSQDLRYLRNRKVSWQW
ncbi:phenylalanine--tRNA ligase subunit alpha [Sulfodiicoccus acidiphilus]|uniref:Phenylalanine--tRNA ligase alpha subunit n=1 Tax=Sulfodiicoccus acidiphilus TaxID=1670455 RepID=A0A348B0I3_9CREN|nr:phenylalanine--tRNA ligase subunit alpha [Sulfodiicoccus acidiphilus]BBD71685.1 phenylalanine--tRNA ligase subunit alpha [Sulfodiicoccus acidiphilus]GGT86614.1 phenylalanine--tRNA ligase subunit alpha [Sulfodiicoccus acidiphilus]